MRPRPIGLGDLRPNGGGAAFLVLDPSPEVTRAPYELESLPAAVFDRPFLGKEGCLLAIAVGT